MDDVPSSSSGDCPTDTSSEALLPLVYDELRKLAGARIIKGNAGLTLQPTALVHEAWIRLGGKFNRDWQSREHFFNAAALTMRRILVDRARQKACAKNTRPAPDSPDFLHNTDEILIDERLLLIDESLQKLENENPELARIVMLKYFAGLSNQEIADTLDLSLRTTVRKWNHAKIRLFQLFTELEKQDT